MIRIFFPQTDLCEPSDEASSLIVFMRTYTRRITERRAWFSIPAST